MLYIFYYYIILLLYIFYILYYIYFRLFTKVCYKVLEQCKDSKCKHIRETIFEVNFYKFLFHYIIFELIFKLF